MTGHAASTLASVVLPATVRAALAYQNRSVLSVAGDTGTSPHWWYRRLNGHTPITVEDLLLIADALGVSPVALLTHVIDGRELRIWGAAS